MIITCPHCYDEVNPGEPLLAECTCGVCDEPFALADAIPRPRRITLWRLSPWIGPAAVMIVVVLLTVTFYLMVRSVGDTIRALETPL